MKTSNIGGKALKTGIFLSLIFVFSVVSNPFAVQASSDDSGYYGSSYDSDYYGSSYDSGYYGSSYDSDYYGSSYDSGYYGSSYDSGSYGSSYTNPDYAYGSSYDSGYYGSSYDSGYYGSSYDSGYYGSSYDSGYYGSSYDSGYYGSSYDSGSYGSSYDSDYYGYGGDYSDSYYSYEPDSYYDSYYSDYDNCYSDSCRSSYYNSPNCYTCQSSYYPPYYPTPIYIPPPVLPPPPPPIAQNPSLRVSCYADRSSVNVDETVHFISYVYGGTGSYAYSWSGTDGISGSSSSVRKSFGTPGTKTATVRVTSGGITRTANCYTTVIEIPINAYCIATPSNPKINDTVVWRANASGGNGNFTYSWSGDASGSSREVSKSYSSSGTKTATVTVTSGGRSITRTCNVYVQEDFRNSLGGSCYASPSNPKKGDTVIWRADATGGDGSYTYRWRGDVSGNGRTETAKYNSLGTKSASVRIESDGHSITRTCSVYVNDDYNDISLGGYCSGYISGNYVYWTAYPSGGTGRYTYSWSGDASGHGQTASSYFTGGGTRNANVTIRSDGKSITRSCSVNTGNPIITIIKTPPGPRAGVLLSQVPYTGVKENVKVALFVLGLGLWSAFLAHLYLKKKALKGGSHRDMIEEFKKQNLANRSIN